VKVFETPSELVADFIAWNHKKVSEFTVVVSLLELFPDLQNSDDPAIISMDTAKQTLRMHEVVIERFTPVLNGLIKDSM